VRLTSTQAVKSHQRCSTWVADFSMVSVLIATRS